MSRARQPPLVTGISPKEGAAWTKVTIRGENLGTGPADLIGLSICGHNCLLTAEWMSASKIVCRVGPAKDDKGEIIVTTKSGGLGTSTVSFKLLRPDRIGILDQSAVWVDEMNYYDMRTDRNKGISPLSLRPSNPLGIEFDKYGPRTQERTHKTRTAINTRSGYGVMVYIPKQKQILPICGRLKYYADTAMAELPQTAAHGEWKQKNYVEGRRFEKN